MKHPPADRWNRLDNAAKLFPPTSSAADPKVFRFACELTEPVRPEPLQTALDEVLEAFPFYRSVLRRGLFWYYLDKSDFPALVHEEDARPCAPLYDKVRKGPLFSVRYFDRRISLEVYHALSDGTGALQFLRSLVCRYLAIVHAEEFPSCAPELDYDASSSEREDDSFSKYYNSPAPHKPAHGPVAYRVRGARLTEHRIRVIEGHVSARAAVTIAREHGTTVTGLLTAALLCAIHEERPLLQRGKPIVLSIPVNLRNYFPSASARNFFGTVNVGYQFTGKESFPDVINAVSAVMAEELTAERLGRRMNEFSALEHNYFARIVPLAFKDAVMLLAYRLRRREVTGGLSNVGRVSMPEPLQKHIRLFDVFTSTNGINLCMCSFGDRMVLTLTAPFVRTDIQKNFFRQLTRLGLTVEIHANRPDEE